ncbi:MAG: hypothetical protein AAF602_26530 [Myxococcota bacterium]
MTGRTLALVFACDFPIEAPGSDLPTLGPEEAELGPTLPTLPEGVESVSAIAWVDGCTGTLTGALPPSKPSRRTTRCPAARTR